MRISYQQIYQAEQKCSKSKRKGAGCQRFEANLIDNLFEIQQVLQSKTYAPKPMRVFVADNGSKPREIYAPHYYDRVIHHILVPRLEKIIAHKFIHNSCANQKNKGTHFAVKRLQKMMRKLSLRGGTTRQSPKLGVIPDRLPRYARNDENVDWAKLAQPNSRVSDNSIVGLRYETIKKLSLRGGTTRQSPESSVVSNRLPQSCLLRNDSDFDAHNDECDLTQKNKTYYLQLDIHNFFYSVDKKILIQILVKHIKVAIKQKKITRDTGRDYYWLCQQILKRNKKVYRTHNTQLPFIKQLHNIDSDKGLPIGNLTSQFFGNVYLNELDQFVKHQLKVKHYVRYVDDFVLLSDSPQQLEKWQTQIQEFLEEKLSLRLKEVAKPKDTAQGVDFLGYIIRPHYNLVRRRILGNMYQRLAQWYKDNRQKVNNGTILHLPKLASDKIDSVFASYIGHFKHAKSHKIIQQKFSQFKWLDLLFYQDNERYKSKRHTKNAVKLISQWDYFRFHYQPFVLLMQVGCYFVTLKHDILSMCSSMHSHSQHGNESKSAPSLRGRYDRGNLLDSRSFYEIATSLKLLAMTGFGEFSNHSVIAKEVRLGQPHESTVIKQVVGLRYALHQPIVNTNIFKILFKQSKLKSHWCECHQAKLPKVLKTLQLHSVSYVVVTQQGYVNNKLRKRKVSQIYISNNLNLKEAI